MQQFERQGAVNRAQDLEAGRLLLPEDFRQRLGVGRQSLSRAVRAGRLFALDGPQVKKVYPAFFVDPRYQQDELAKVSRALGNVPGEVKWDFFN